MEVVDAGIDTWGLRWRVSEDGPAAHFLASEANLTAARGARLLPDPVWGHRVGWWPEHHLVFADGHPGGDGPLGRASGLEAARRAVEDACEDVGLELPRGLALDEPDPLGGPALLPTEGFAGIARLDVTADVRSVPGVGQAVKQAAAALLSATAPTSSLVRCFYRGGQVETVALAARGRGTTGRIYDKGLEAASSPRHTLTRLEGQYRWSGSQRRIPADLDGPWLAKRLDDRFRLLWTAAEGLIVTSNADKLADRVAAAVERRELTLAQGSRILGDQLLMSRMDRVPAARNTVWRARKRVRESGYLLTTTEQPGEDFSFEDLRGALARSPRWGE